MMIARLNSNMAGKKIAKGSEEWQMFQDFWKLAQDLWIPEDTEEYWQEVMNRTNEFHEKYKTPYAKHFAVGFLNALDEVSRKGKK